VFLAKRNTKNIIEEYLGKAMKIQLTHEETELLVLAGLMASDSPMPLLKQEIEKCTVTITINGTEIEITYKEGCEPE
jgi:hypothetical protein